MHYLGRTTYLVLQDEVVDFHAKHPPHFASPGRIYVVRCFGIYAGAKNIFGKIIDWNVYTMIL
jgi:hypothetical protein